MKLNHIKKITALTCLLSTIAVSACQPGPTTPSPSPEATAEPDTAPTAVPTSEATAEPTPTAEATPEPTPEATPEPTPEPTPEATPEPTPEPTPEATPEPTPEPTPTPLSISGFVDLEVIAGNGEEGSSETGENADEVRFPEQIVALAGDNSDNIFMLEEGNGILGQITAEIKRDTSSEGILEYRLYWDIEKGLQRVTGMHYDRKNNLFYIVQQGQHRVVRYDPTSKEITVVAGTGSPGFRGDGPATEVPLLNPTDVAVDATGNLYITDTGNHLIRQVTPEGEMKTFAGQYVQDTKLPDDADANDVPSLEPVGETKGDGGPATEARVDTPDYLAVGPDGAVYFSSRSQTIRRIANGNIDVYAGSGQVGYNGDDFRADRVHIHNPGPLRFGPDHALYFVDRGNYRVRRVIPNEEGILVINDVIGNGNESDHSSVVGDPLQAELRPTAIAFDTKGNLYVYDAFHYRLRMAKRQLNTSN